MRCPKCHYISFDSGGRCRNCGYEFALSVSAAPMDLPIHKRDEPIGPMADLQLGNARGTNLPSAPMPDVEIGHERGGEGTVAPTVVSSRVDLPLFTDFRDDAPLITAPAVPRAPLSVRRAPVVAQTRTQPVGTPEEAQLDLEASAADELRALEARIRSAAGAAEVTADGLVAAGAAARIVAAIIDAVILASIDATVVYFTLELCGLRLDEIRVLPPVPLIAFLLLLNGGYFATFTAAAGQTIGKMIAGIRVVPYPDRESDGRRVSFGYATVRAAAYLLSLLSAGLGLLPALFSPDRRALHDRLAETRVVKA